MLAGRGVDHLGVQADVIRETEQPIEQVLGLVQPARVDQSIEQPEGAQQERALLARQAVGGAVAMHMDAVTQIAVDDVNGGQHARMRRRKEP